MSSNDTRPIIIKRKKVVGGGGHHGGAWKVAYADFVTAMMAFFMLMWLLNATTENQRKGLADYFSPTIPVARVSGGGDGAFGGNTIFSEETLAQSGIGGLLDNPPGRNEASGNSGIQQNEEQQKLEELEANIIGRGGESLVAEMALKHIITRVTDEGLMIEVFDLDGAPLFDAQTTEPNPILTEIVDILTEVFLLVENKLSVAAHTRTFSPLLIENPSWSLTTSRAQTVREMFEGAELPETRVQRVIGYGQQKPYLKNKISNRNNRLEIILLREQT